MLKEATIFKVPRAVSQSQNGFLKGCGVYNGNRDFSCSPYGGNCIDATYNPTPTGASTAAWVGVGITAVGSIAAVVALT